MAILVPALNASSQEQAIAYARILRGLAPLLVQVDVSDGIFGYPKNFAIPAIISREFAGLHFEIYLDIHLMVHDAAAAIREWAVIHPARLTVHWETLRDPAHTLAEIRKRGIAPGLALGPDVLPEQAEAHFGGIELLLFVAVPPGRSGQQFDRRVLERVRAVRTAHPLLDIGVDGGVTAALIPELLAAGATTLCVASAIVGDPDPAAAYRALKRLVES